MTEEIDPSSHNLFHHWKDSFLIVACLGQKEIDLFCDLKLFNDSGDKTSMSYFLDLYAFGISSMNDLKCCYFMKKNRYDGPEK
jgi:hypothetical protein